MAKRTDHPRSRGEYVVSTEVEEGSKGSSPLSRGIRPRRVGWQLWERIIPALAGNTSLLIKERPPRQDHPRSRGEYARRMVADTEGIGSSPLSRGIREAKDGALGLHGIIPALAGNTPRRVMT